MNDETFENELRKFQFTPPSARSRSRWLRQVSPATTLVGASGSDSSVESAAKPRRELSSWLPWAALAACWIIGLSLQADAGTLVWQRPASTPQSKPMQSPMQRHEAILQLLAEVNAALRETTLPTAPPHLYPDQTNHQVPARSRSRWLRQFADQMELPPHGSWAASPSHMWHGLAARGPFARSVT